MAPEGEGRKLRVTERLGIVFALAFVILVVVGKLEQRPKILRTEIETSASPMSLFAALLDPEAIRSLGELPSFGPLVGIEWSRAPGRYARVTERYERGTEVYWVLDFQPGRRIEERYVSPEPTPRPLEVELRQRWTMEPLGSKTRFVNEVEIQPLSVRASIDVLFQLALRGDDDDGRQRERLERLARYAELHPAATASAAIARAEAPRAAPTPGGSR